MYGNMQEIFSNCETNENILSLITIRVGALSFVSQNWSFLAKFLYSLAVLRVPELRFYCLSTHNCSHKNEISLLSLP